MQEIKIKSTLKLFDIDKLYEELYKGVKAKNTISIILPKRIAGVFFSITPSLIQFIATWIRIAEKGKLIIDIDNEDNIEKRYEQEFFFPIIALAWNDVTIENKNGENLRPLLREFQNDFILKMRRVESMKGEKLMFVNLDHFNENKGLLHFFESKGLYNTNEKDLNSSLRDPIMEDVLKYSKTSRQDFEKIYDDIVSIIYELMKNTYEWARDDSNKVPLSPNIRGLYLRFYKKTKTKILDDYSEDKAISNFFDHNKITHNNLDQTYFIEISVFDSGIGFINKFNNTEDIVLSDIEIIKKCLIKNQTSSTGLLKNEKGIGLDRILNILNGKGFLRIKTDKYCLYRDLIQDPHINKENIEINDMDLYDWKKSSKDSFTKTPFCSGSNINILYPLPQNTNTYE